MVRSDAKFTLQIYALPHAEGIKFRMRKENFGVPIEITLTMLSSYLEFLRKKYQHDFEGTRLSS